MNYVRLDELDLAADTRPVSEKTVPEGTVPEETVSAETVSAGHADGVDWTIRAECDGAGVLSTVVTYTCQGVAATFSVLGASLHNGQLLSMWVGRERDACPFLLLRTAPAVTHATAVLASGERREVALSPVVEDFRLRFGGLPLAGDDPLASVELSGPSGDPQVVDLWRPPRLAVPRLAVPRPAGPGPAGPGPAGPGPAAPQLAASRLVPPARNG